jgi:hypothetical protein
MVHSFPVEDIEAVQRYFGSELIVQPSSAKSTQTACAHMLLLTNALVHTNRRSPGVC